MVKRIACFFTGGFTESGALQYFIKKIDDNIVIKQFCPNNAMKRRGVNGQPNLVKKVSGLTGKALIKYVIAGDESSKRKCKNASYTAYCNEIQENIRRDHEISEN